jgi:hypothetical protein
MKIPGLTIEDLERMGAEIGPEAIIPGEKPKAMGFRKSQTPGQMNKTEQSYWEHLLLQRAEGKILWCSYEPLRFRLAPRTTYTPDFGVMLKDHTLEFHETKGFLEEDAIVKFKMVRELYWMFAFRMFKRGKGRWNELYSEFGKDGE